MLAAVLLISAVASTEAPERKVENNIIMSARDPEVRIGLPKSVRYVGADRWILYGIADCELHGFVDVDSNGKVERIYWVQFEGYIPEKPELKYQYTSPRRVTIGDMEFILDTGTRAKDEKARPGSDREHLNALIAAKGYKLPDGMIWARFVHLLDATKRRELMIIYAEDVAPTGFTANDLRENGKAREQWPAIASGMIERAKQRIEVR